VKKRHSKFQKVDDRQGQSSIGHEINSSGINMSQKRIEGAIAFTTSRTLKELQSFLGLINYFKDHLRDHALIARPIYQLVADATKSGDKTLVSDELVDVAFKAENQCP